LIVEADLEVGPYVVEDAGFDPYEEPYDEHV
jgi:hypothetical protein